MPHAERLWKGLNVTGQPDGGATKLLCAVVDGLRVYREEHYAAPDQEGHRALTHERYLLQPDGQAYRTMEQALDAATVSTLSTPST